MRCAGPKETQAVGGASTVLDLISNDQMQEDTGLDRVASGGAGPERQESRKRPREEPGCECMSLDARMSCMTSFRSLHVDLPRETARRAMLTTRAAATRRAGGIRLRRVETGPAGPRWSGRAGCRGGRWPLKATTTAIAGARCRGTAPRAAGEPTTGSTGQQTGADPRRWTWREREAGSCGPTAGCPRLRTTKGEGGTAGPRSRGGVTLRLPATTTGGRRLPSARTGGARPRTMTGAARRRRATENGRGTCLPRTARRPERPPAPPRGGGPPPPRPRGPAGDGRRLSPDY